MKLLYKILVVFVICTMAACSEDFLEVDPYGKISSDDYLKTEGEAFTALVGVYDLMQWNYNRPWNSVFMVKVIPSDESNAGSSESDQPPYQQLDDFIHQSDNPVIDAIWEGFYKTINLTNTIINQVEEDTDVKKTIVAEAKALRAFNYFELVTLFGDVPMFIVNPTIPADFHQPRSATTAIYTQIEKDLKDAIGVLPLKSALSASHKFRLSKGAAQSILGKVLLYQEKYSEAVAQFEAVISSGEYDMNTPFGNIWDKEYELGSESVFEILFSSAEGYDWGNFPWGDRPESNIHLQLMGPREGVFGMGNTGLINGWGFNIPTAKIGNLFANEGDAVRSNASLISEADLLAAGGSVAEGDIHDYEGYVRVKYCTRESETNTSDGAVSALNYITGWRLIRYADVLLMAAEAYNKSNQDAKAIIELNKVRARASMPDVSASGDALFNAIVKERSLELAFEGQRYWDLVRWGLAEQELGSLGFVKGKHEHFPIPLNEIISNNAITEDDQNPGF